MVKYCIFRMVAISVLVGGFLCAAPSRAQAAGEKIQTGMFGLWAYKPWEEGLRHISKSGFDLVIIEASKSRLDKVQAQGLKAIVAFTLFRDTSEDPVKWKKYLDDLKVKVQELKDHPAVMAWYPVDEPDHRGVSVQAVHEAVQLIRSLDKSRPIFAVVNDPKKWEKYLPLFDILSIDPYLLIGSRDTPEKVRIYLKKIKADLARLNIERPVWVTLGAFEFIPKHAEHQKFDWYQRVTPDQFNTMVDIVTEEGADGILVYTLAQSGNPRYKDWSMPVDSPRLWDAVRKLPGRVRR